MSKSYFHHKLKCQYDVCPSCIDQIVHQLKEGTKLHLDIRFHASKLFVDNFGNDLEHQEGKHILRAICTCETNISRILQIHVFKGYLQLNSHGESSDFRADTYHAVLEIFMTNHERRVLLESCNNCKRETS